MGKVTRWKRFVWAFTFFPLWRFVFFSCEHGPEGNKVYNWRLKTRGKQ